MVGNCSSNMGDFAKPQKEILYIYISYIADIRVDVFYTCNLCTKNKTFCQCMCLRAYTYENTEDVNQI